MRKLFFVFVALLWIMAGIQLIQNLNREDEGQLVEAFNKTNCMAAKSSIVLSGELDKEYQTQEKQEQILRGIAEELGITGGCEITKEQDGTRMTLQLYKEAAHAETNLRIVSIENEISENVIEAAQYLLVEISLYDKLDCAVIYKENLEKMAAQMGMSAEVSLQFEGELPGEVKGQEREEIVEHLLESISAKIRQKHEEDGLYTVYAYTELAGKSQRIKGKDVNVNVAVTYDEQNQCTKLYLATPILKEDY